jgi:hypothetical protein
VGEPVTTLAAASASSNAAPGTLAFLIVFGMAVVLTLLFRSMSKHLRRVNSAARNDQDAAASAQDTPGDRPGPR